MARRRDSGAILYLGTNVVLDSLSAANRRVKGLSRGDLNET